MARYETREDVKEDRIEKSKEYEGQLPDYLVDYFDNRELAKIKEDFYKRLNTYGRDPDGRKEFVIDRKERFWKENEFEIVKKGRRIGSHLEAVYPEPPRAEERVEQEADLSPEEIKALVEVCGNNIYAFAVRYFPHYLKQPSSELHRYLYGMLNKEYAKRKKKDFIVRKTGFKKAIAAPRFNAKSSIISLIFPLWCIAYNKKKFIILLSDTAGQAEEFLFDLKQELEHNVKLIKDFPHICGQGPLWRLNEIITSNDIKMMALGTGNKVRGRRFGVHRPDLIIGDDLENGEMVRSKSKRDFIRHQWFDKDVAFVGGEEGTVTDFLVVGTVLGKDSLLNALLDPNEYPDWNSKRFAAVKSFSTSYLWDKWAELYKNVFDISSETTSYEFFLEHKEEMLEGTDVLWPEGDPYYDLMIVKLTRPASFATEKQNEAVDPTKILITEDQLHFENFSTNPTVRAILDDRRNPHFGFLDPSLGKKADSGDYSCIVTLLRDLKTGLLFVVDINMKRRDVDSQIDVIIDCNDNFHYKLFGVETNAFQYVVADNLRKKSRKDGIYIPVKEINQYHDKKMRVEGIIPLLLDGTVIFDSLKRRSNQQYAMGIEQLCSFTGEDDEHDDFPDALASCVEIAKKPRFKTITSQNKR